MIVHVVYINFTIRSYTYVHTHTYTHNMYTHTHTHTHTHPQIPTHTPSIAQIITQPPVSITAALDTNATFSCRGNGEVLWQINGTQIRTANQVPNFASIQVFVPLPRDSSSELIITATGETNATLIIICAVDQGVGMGTFVRSDPVRLLVYGMSVQ